MYNFYLKNCPGPAFQGLGRKLLLIMKITTLILITVILHVGAATLAQKVTLNVKNAPLVDIFNQISAQTDYDFAFTTDALKGAKPVTINVKNEELGDVLTKILQGQDLEFTIDNKSVVIKPKETALPDNIKNKIRAELAQVSVSGRVTDSLGTPLIGATIANKTANKSTTTDDKGEFSIGAQPGDQIAVTYIGYSPYTFKVTSNTPFQTIIMRAFSSKLDEVVVSNGYQTLPLERATGSFAQVDNELFNRSVSTNVLDRIVDVTPGLQKLPSFGGTSFSQSSIMIRGISTINANAYPLIVIDGFPYDEGNEISNTGTVDILNNLNPNDVESVTVLKDAAAASIWGVRAGNGVIVITTKKGKFNQKAKVQFSSNVTVQAKPDLNYIPTISPADAVAFDQYLFNTNYWQGNINNGANTHNFSYDVPPVVELLNAVRNGSMSATAANAQIAAYQNHNVNDDISKYLLQNSVNQQYALNLSGGSDKYNYYASVGYDNDLPNQVGNKYNRLTVKYDNTFRPLPNLELNGYIYSTQSETTSNAPNTNSTTTPPYTMLADAQGNHLPIYNGLRLPYVDTAKTPGLLDWHYRPLDELNNADNTSKQIDTRLGVGLKYTILPGLNAEVKYQYDKLLTLGYNYYNQQTFYTRNLINLYAQPGGVYPVPLGDIIKQSTSELDSWNARGQLNYTHSWKNNQLVALAGMEGRQVTSDGNYTGEYGYNPNTGSSVTAINYTTLYPLNPAQTASSIIPNIAGVAYNTLNRYLSYFGNGAYTYQDKYTLTASARLDESNFFGVNANDRYVPLWSAGALWDISKEGFYRVSWLPYLKLRATYGYNGNTNNSATSLTTIAYQQTSTNAIITNVPYAQLASPPNPDLQWEKTNVINFGIDFSTKDQRIGGSLEYYIKKGIDLIEPIPTVSTVGFLSFTGNAANLSGNGVDIALNTRNLIGRFAWNTSFFFSYNVNKVTAYSQPLANSTAANNYLGGGAIVIDRPLFPIYSYKWAGLNPANGDPQVYVSNVVSTYANAYSNATGADLQYNGPSIPPYFGSVRNTFGYQGISLSFNVTYKFGYYFRKNSVNYYNL